MCDNAWDWARARGLLIKNPIHGAEEADIPYKSFWKNTDESGNRLSFEGRVALEVSLLASHGLFQVSLCVCRHVCVCV